MGGSKQTTKTKEQGTSQVSLPAWMTGAGERTFNRAEATALANPIQAYGRPIRSGLSTNEGYAGQAARETYGAGTADLDRARAMTSRAALGDAPRVQTRDVGVATMDSSQQDTAQMEAAGRGFARVGGAPRSVAARQGPAMGYDAMQQDRAPE
ncbi:MAG TPA: hypothetical protein VGR19_02260, partial [Allosphingosinicella sp.]|nr:hypothetical protein [Allosphingosinicella sp.]